MFFRGATAEGADGRRGATREAAARRCMSAPGVETQTVRRSSWDISPLLALLECYLAPRSAPRCGGTDLRAEAGRDAGVASGMRRRYSRALSAFYAHFQSAAIQQY